MGIYDRDYYRGDARPGPSLTLRAPTTIVGILILINIAVFFANGLLTGRTDAISSWLSAHGDTLTKPWMWWQLVTYGFVHAPDNLQHIIFNMLGLFFLGRAVEMHYGRAEFVRLYLVMLAVGSLVWVLGNQGNPYAALMGASGAVTGVVVLFALNFPRQTLLLFFVLPVPAWLVGVIVVVGDALGAMGRESSGNIAYGVHLAGAAFAFLYFRFGWNLTRLTRGKFSWVRFTRRPKLRIHDPGGDEANLIAKVDQILEKIHTQGEASLTRKERRILESASRRYQKRRDG
ncbi:MAG TPA: rhomboid family intramembrane serine protease [Thermoguttaceae bacterium]|nr:rhomboid family intramembrane serine protease [Thermoguttaceae bacterium]